VSVLRDLYRGTTAFDFVGSRRIWFTLSAGIVLLSLAAFGLRGGFDLSVDFQGGTLVEAENPRGASVAEVRDIVLALGITGARVQATGGGDGMRVQAAQLSPAAEQQLVESLAEVTGSDPEDASRQSVGPTFGRQITDSAIRALVVFLLVAAGYIAWRLEWKMALIALVALFHDLLFTGGVYALVGFEVSPATVIAILTILGYSLYDTVVVFDKVLENVRERGDRQTMSSIVNMSMNQVFMRSINTSLTSLLPIGSLLFVGSFLLGATTLREFALALFIGVAVGTYSSVFLAGPLLAVWKEREDHWQKVRRRVERKGGEVAFETRSVFAPSVAEAPEAVVGSGGAAPRPPKKRRKKR
jgi:preprotein translocase subunit SecF